jgi:alpha-ketoglutarate-dependent 2,4-dichlorophenoxyacetate dioxygenase
MPTAGAHHTMPLTIRPLHPVFAVEILGVEGHRPLDTAVRDAIQEALDRHAVAVVRGQRLTDEQQMAFAAAFGPLERYALSYRRNADLRLKHPEMVDVSNLDAATGRPQDRSARVRMINLGNRLWHTDSSFRKPPGALSMLHAHAVPGTGGETEFADMRAAYDALPEDRKRALDGLWVQHSLMHSRAVLGFEDFAPEERAALPPVEQPLVRTHPRSGRNALYLGAHASHIVGMPVPEGRVALMELTELATQRRFVYRHRWRAGDLVIWDNRATLHRAMPFDESEVRDLRRVTTSDVDAETRPVGGSAAAE